MRISASGFFHESLSPKPPKYNIRVIFEEIFASEGAPQVSMTPMTMANFAPATAGVVDTGSKLPLVSRIPAANNGNNIIMLTH